MKFQFFLLFIIFFSFGNLQAQKLSFNDSLVYVIEYDMNKYIILDAYFELVCEFFLNGEEKGNIYYKKMLAYAKANNIESGEGLGLLAKSYQAFYDKNDIETALKYILEGVAALEIAADTSFLIRCEYADALNQTGLYYEEISAYDEALAYYFKALDYSNKYNCTLERIDVYSYLSYLYSEYFNDDTLGIKYLKDALILADELDDEDAYSMIYGNLTMQYIEQKDYKNASYYLEKVLEIDRLAKDTFGLSHGYLQKATLFFEEGKTEQAKESIDKALTFTKGYYDWATDVQIMRGRIALASGDILNADFHFKEALKYAKTDGTLEDQYNALRELVDLANKRKNTSEALEYYNLMFAVKDSIDSQWKISNVMKAEVLARTKEIKAEKEAIEFDKKILALTVRQQKRFIVLIVIFLMIALAGGIIILRQKQRLEQANLLLVQKTQELTGELQKKNQNTIHSSPIEDTKKTRKKQKQEVVLLKKLEIDLAEKIKTALEEEKIFLDKKLTLAKFAERLDTNTSYLSKAINNIYNKRFRTLINEYRVKEVLLFFETKESEQLTIFALAQKAGFSSKSSFNTAFREYTGVTPTFYLKNMASSTKKRQDL